MNKESVWDYPRPPRIEAVQDTVLLKLDKETLLCKSQSSFRILETSHPPTIYIPQKDIQMDFLKKNSHNSFCEWKGKAEYWNLIYQGKFIKNIAWSYPNPDMKYEELKDHLSFYPSKLYSCFIGDELVQAQEGDFYGGWITSNLE